MQIDAKGVQIDAKGVRIDAKLTPRLAQACHLGAGCSLPCVTGIARCLKSMKKFNGCDQAR